MCRFAPWPVTLFRCSACRFGSRTVVPSGARRRTRGCGRMVAPAAASWPSTDSTAPWSATRCLCPAPSSSWPPPRQHQHQQPASPKMSPSRRGCSVSSVPFCSSAVRPRSERWPHHTTRHDTVRCDTRCYFNVGSKADMSQHRTNN